MGRKLILLLLMISVFSGIGYFVHCIVHQVTVVVPNAYASEWAATFVIEHLKANSNQWPRSWADLKDEYERQVASGHAPAPTWQELQSRVQIDWNAQPSLLSMANSQNKPPLHVIWLSDGSKSRWQGSEPNSMVLQFLLGYPGGDPSQ